MDGSPAPLPPIGNPAPAAPPFGSPGVASGAPMTRPVGRPSNDPENDRQKIERNAERKRIEGVIPKQLDSKLCIYRIRNGRAQLGKPVITILVSELEKIQAENGQTTDEVVAERISERFQTGSFQCRFLDKSGRPVLDYPPWEVSLDEEENEDDMEDLDGSETVQVQAAGPHPGYASPPPAPSVDLATIANFGRTERNEEARRSNETMTMLTAMLTSQQSQAAAAAQQQQQMMMQFQQQQQQMQMQAKAEAEAREERERVRRAEFRTTLLTAAPLLLPFAQKLLGLDKEKGLDPATQVLIEMVKNKGSDGDLLKQTSAIMGEMVKSQMQLQSAGATQAVQMQGDVSQMVFKNMMGTMKELMEQSTGLKKDKEPDWLDRIAQFAPAIIEAAKQNGAEVPTLPQPPVAAPVPARRAKIPAPPAAAAPAEPAAPVAKPKEDEFAKYTTAQRVRMSLLTIRRMSLGEIPASDRFNALVWMAKAMPEDMRTAVAGGDDEKVLSLGSPVVMGTPVLMQWFQDDTSEGFLKTALEDLRLMFAGQMDAEKAKASVAAHAAFLDARKVTPAPVAPVPAPAPESAAPAVQEPAAGIAGSTPLDAGSAPLPGTGSAPTGPGDAIPGPGSQAPRRVKMPPPPPQG